MGALVITDWLVDKFWTIIDKFVVAVILKLLQVVGRAAWRVAAMRLSNWMIDRVVQRFPAERRKEQLREWRSEVANSSPHVALRFAFGLWRTDPQMVSPMHTVRVTRISVADERTTVTFNSRPLSIFRWRELWTRVDESAGSATLDGQVQVSFEDPVLMPAWEIRLLGESVRRYGCAVPWRSYASPFVRLVKRSLRGQRRVLGMR
jgi:hypothetical protein